VVVIQLARVRLESSQINVKIFIYFFFFYFSNETDHALAILKSLIKIDRRYLCLLLQSLIAGGHALQEWILCIRERGVFESKLNTHLLFAFLDGGMEDKAEELTKVN